MDCIYIKNLQVFGRHGVFEEENKLGQLFVLNAKLYVDTYDAGVTDDLECSVDYGKICHLLEEAMTERTFKLIETAAWYCVKKILLAEAQVIEVELSIDKPWAPIGLHLDSAGVCVQCKRHKAWLGIGSNIGDSKKIIEDAIKKLDETEDITVKQVSDLIVTKPYGGVEQPDFINGCIEIETLMPPKALLKTLMAIEASFGRERTIHWGPRTLDLDILLYDDIVMNEPDLTIPHVDMNNRQFVLEPLAQIAGWYVHPVTLKTIAQQYEALKKRG